MNKLAEMEIEQYELFNKFMLLYIRDFRKREENYFPMSMIGSCARKLAFSYLKYEQGELTARQERSFFHGKIFENYIRWKILNNPYGIRWDNYQIEVKIDDPPQIGHPEGVIWCDTITNLVNMLNNGEVNINPDKYKPHHLEIKTIAQAIFPKATYGYTYTCDKGMRIAYPDYIAQQQTYLHLLRDYACDDTFFLYENKNTDHVHGECVPYIEEEFNKTQDRLKSIYDIISNGGLPEKEYENGGGFPCSWEHGTQKCSYYKYCWEEKNV